MNAWAYNGDYEDNELPCEMLEWENGEAICMIQLVYGYKMKPIACRQYPEDGELCFREKGQE